MALASVGFFSITSRMSGTIVADSIIGNWQAAETALVTLGVNSTRNKVHSFLVGIQNLVGVISIRMYTRVDGVERQIFPDPLIRTFTVAVDGPAIAVIDGTFGLTDALRITVQSTAAADNGMAVTYNANMEAMS